MLGLLAYGMHSSKDIYVGGDSLLRAIPNRDPYSDHYNCGMSVVDNLNSEPSRLNGGVYMCIGREQTGKPVCLTLPTHVIRYLGISNVQPCSIKPMLYLLLLVHVQYVATNKL